MKELIQEIKSQIGNTKGLLFLVAFRTSHFFTKNKILKFLGFPIRFFYKFTIQWVFGIDIEDSTQIGFGFCVYHGQSLIINKDTIIGKFCVVRQNTTIGIAKKGGACPIIGDNVTIGANSVIIGEIKIGNNSIIGAGSVVIKDVPDNSIVAGNPAKVIRITNEI
jgi:putative colanic acid biosynthesis acetyltransferase WcaB